MTVVTNRHTAKKEKWAHILKEPSVLSQTFGREGFGDMMEGEQRPVLPQAVLTLHRLQENGDELWPLPGAVQTGHLGYQYCDLGGYLSGEAHRGT